MNGRTYQVNSSTAGGRGQGLLALGIMLVGCLLSSCRRDDAGAGAQSASQPSGEQTASETSRSLGETEEATQQVLPASRGALADCNVLLVSLDTTRADHLGCYGYAAARTPNLDRLAGAGVLFRRALAPAPTTVPSHASMLTGLYPRRHGARVNGVFRLGEGNVTLAETLAEHGYATGATVSAFVLDARFGFAQGFDYYDDETGVAQQRSSYHFPERPAGQTTARALAWLRGVAQQRFFLWVHYFDPHAPYRPPGRFAEHFRRVPYDGEIAFMDSELGKLLEALEELEQSDRTLVVVAGDHGENLGQHGEQTHGWLAYDSTIRVPLLMRCGPHLGRGLQIDRQVSLVDIQPTVLALLGLENPVETDGVNLTRTAAPRPLFIETYNGLIEYGWAALLGVYEGDYKYIHGPNPELFNLARDPAERTNVVAAHPRAVKRLRGYLSEFFGPEFESGAAPVPTEQPAPDARAKLEALGYLRASVGDAPAVAARPDPREMLPLLDRVQEAVQRYQPYGHMAQSIALLEGMAREHPNFEPTFWYLGTSYRQKGYLAEAERAFRRCLELRPDAVRPLHALAETKMAQGEYEEAIALFGQVLERSPEHYDARYCLGYLLTQRGDFTAAARHLQVAFEIDETCAEHMVAAFIAAGRAAELPGLIEPHLAAAPTSCVLRNALASYLQNVGRFAEAEALLREGVALSPDSHAALRSLVLFLVACPDSASRKPTEAVAIAERHNQQTGGSDPDALHTLALVYSFAGRMQDGIAAAEKARQLVGDAGDRELRETIDQLLARQREALNQGVTRFTPETRAGNR
ncbi:MAG: sulfatase-like hydrolase/transferase [Planctomycetes bacterium]|nr:sulfatase-like hydrolase/transferase [Planctomycetota bacterium]